MNDEKEILDEEEFEEGDEEIITLATPDGEEVDFTQIATVEFEGNLYVIMQPVEPVSYTHLTLPTKRIV